MWQLSVPLISVLVGSHDAHPLQWAPNRMKKEEIDTEDVDDSFEKLYHKGLRMGLEGGVTAEEKKIKEVFIYSF